MNDQLPFAPLANVPLMAPVAHRVVFVRDMQAAPSVGAAMPAMIPTGRCWFTVDGERCDDLTVVRRVVAGEAGADTDGALLDDCMRQVREYHLTRWPTRKAAAS